MAISAAMRNDIIELAVITNNAAPGTTLLAELVALAEAGQTLTQIAETLVARSSFTSTYPTHQTSSEFGTEWIGNLLPEANAALQAECVIIVEAHINGGGSIAALMADVQVFMSTNTAANLATHIANFNNKVAVATYHTITSEAAAEWAIPSSVTSVAATVVTGKAAVDTALTPAAAVVVVAPVATFALTSDVSSADEGGDIVFTLATANVAAGTEYSYVISGVESADISGSKTGTIKIDSNGNANVSITTVADTSTEGAQTLTMTVAGKSAAVTVNDTSLTAAASALTLDLTTAANNLLGAATNDYIDGSLDSTNQTLTSSDTVNGGAGTDTLYVEVSGTGTYTPTITNTETIQGNFSGAGTVSMLRSSGVTSFENLDSTAAVSFTNVDSAAGVTLKGSNSSQNVTLGFTAAAGAGTADAIDIQLSNVTGGAYTANLIETLNVYSNDTANSITLAGSKATTVNVFGSQNTTLGTLPAKTATLDASASTGITNATAGKATGAALTGGTGNDLLTGAAGNDTLTGNDGNDTLKSGSGGTYDKLYGGAGSDTLDMGATLNSYDIVDGGAGTDTLSVSAAVTTAAQVTNVETLTTSLIDAAQDMDPFTATTITTVASTGTGGTISFTDIGSGVTQWNIRGAAPTTATLTSKATDTNADTAPTISIGKYGSNVTVSNLVASTYETMTINSYNLSTASSYTNTITNMDNDVATSMTITGARPLVISSSDSTVLATFDASAATGAVTLTANDSTAAAGTYTGGSGSDSFAGGTGKDTMTMGTGNDTVTGGGGNDTISGGTGNDTLSGDSGKDVITGGDGNDIIDGVTGIDNLSGGAGNDSFAFATTGDLTGGSVLVRDTVDGGTGTDTVTVTTAVALTPYLTSIEKVTATMTDAVALNLTNASSLTTLTVATGSTAGASITGLATGVTAKIYDADFATLDTVAGAAITVQTYIDRTAATVITDAATVTLKGTTIATGTEDYHSVTLDNTDTTSLTVTGSTSASEVTTGAISNTDALTTLVASTSTTAATLVVGAMADADSLTSVTATGVRGALTLGAIGATGSAEVLSTVTADASLNSVVTFGDITADTTNSLVENDLAITATTDTYASSQIVFGAITNTEGNITGTFSGGGDVDTGNITATDVTLTISSGDTNTIDDITASDDIVVTTSGSGKVTITAISGSDDMTLTSTSTDTVTITTIEDGIDDITLDASGATGALLIGTNSDTGSTSVMTATGGTGNDSLVGAEGKDTLTGNAGNDTLEGGGANDTISGGDGNDAITSGTGIDSITGGAGNDTITMGANLTSSDKIDGGDGTDTLSFTVNSTTGTLSASQVTNVEKTAIVFGTAAGGAYSGGAGATTHTVTATIADSAVIMTNIATGSTINVSGEDDVETLYVDTAAGATLTLGLGHLQTGADSALGDITVVDAANVTITSKTAAATWDDITLDNTDTTSVTVKASLLALTTGLLASTNAVSTLTVSSVYGATVMETMLDADGLTTLNISGSIGAVTVGVIGADSDTGDAAKLSDINITAAGGSDVTVGNIFADTGAAASAAYLSTVAVDVNLTGSTSASSIGVIDAEGSTMTLTIANAGVIDSGSFKADGALSSINATVSGSGATTVTALTAGTGSLTLTSSGSGAKVYTAVDSTNDVTGTFTDTGAITITAATVTDDGTFDFSAATGVLNIDVEGVLGDLTVTGGADTQFTTLTIGGSTQQATIALGDNGVTDQIIMGTASDTTTVTISGFQAGLTAAGAAITGADAIDLDNTGIEAMGETSSLILPATSAVITTNNHVLVDIAVGTPTDLDLINQAATILVLDGNFATSGMVETALEAGGNTQLTAGSAIADNDGFLVAWDDGTNSYLSLMTNRSAGIEADGATITSGSLVGQTLITFTGVSDVDTLTAANFGTAFIA